MGSSVSGRRSLDAAFAAGTNSLALLRLVLAGAVIWHHAYPIGGFDVGLDPLHRATAGRVSIGNVAVCSFFGISGFLVTRSWTARSDPAHAAKLTSRLATYGRHRALRILPGFWFALVVMAFVIGPMGWLREGGGLVDYPWRGAAGFVGRDVFLPIHQSTIGGVLATVPFGDGSGAVLPGSMWTLIYEALAYLLVAVLGTVGLLARRMRWSGPVLLVASVGVTVAMARWGTAVEIAPLSVVVSAETARFAVAFVSGMALSLWGDRVPMHPGFGGAALVAVAASVWWGGWEPWGVVLLPYVLLWLAVSVPNCRADAFGDLSYGLYVFGFPVQQLVATTGVRDAGPVAFALVSLAVTVPFALVSWHLVERPALRFKDGRAWRRTSPRRPVAAPR